MKLILTAAVDHLGIPGDIVEVKDGYGRNYLLPRGHAIRWTKGSEKQIEALTIQLDVRAGESGKLFGAVTPADVASAIKKSGGPLVDKRSIEIAKPIKSTGKHTVGVKLHDAVTAHVALAVNAQA